MRAVKPLLVLAAIACLLAPGVTYALDPPAGPVVLTITGRISETNREGAAEFDIAMLEALGTATLVTSTPWTVGPQEFVGVPMSVLMDAVGADGTVLLAAALNDYHAEVPIGDFDLYPVLLAFRMNGSLMSVRDKGPLWIVYPRDEHPELAEPGHSQKWVWQLAELEVQ